MHIYIDINKFIFHAERKYFCFIMRETGIVVLT